MGGAALGATARGAALGGRYLLFTHAIAQQECGGRKWMGIRVEVDCIAPIPVRVGFFGLIF
ncbi:hypothetical protein DAI22_06g220500 [Oryza sativa Japonica Group]|jgi:hypothetical protein|nr:hypothetical protein DAI22_06g220500 [Oryza sativa Japonica Group]